MPALRFFSPLLVCLSLIGTAAARPLRSEVEVVMFAIPEGVWQAKYEGRFQEHPDLWRSLEDDANRGTVERPLEMKCLLIENEKVVQRHGEEKEFAEGWEAPFPYPAELKPTQKTKRFIGTTVEICRVESDEGDPTLKVELSLEHHLAPPVMQRINYANAATGAERDKLSVEYPQFEKIEWKGRLFVTREWRLVTNLLRPQREEAGKDQPAAPAIRFVVFIKRP